MLREVSLSGNYLVPNYSDCDSRPCAMCLWAAMWTGRLTARVTHLYQGQLKCQATQQRTNPTNFPCDDPKTIQMSKHCKINLCRQFRKKFSGCVICSSCLVKSNKIILGTYSEYLKVNNSALLIKCLPSGMQQSHYSRNFHT